MEIIFVQIEKENNWTEDSGFIMNVKPLDLEYGGTDFSSSVRVKTIDDGANWLIQYWKEHKVDHMVFDCQVVLRKVEDDNFQVGNESRYIWQLKKQYLTSITNLILTQTGEAGYKIGEEWRSIQEDLQ